MNNRISLSISKQEKDELKQAIEVLIQKLLPLLIELAEGEARRLALMGDKSYPFVTKSFELAQQYPEFAGLINMEEYAKDVEAYKTLWGLYVPLSQLYKKLNDSLMLAGSEAYTASLTYYGTVKEARKRKTPNSEVIYRELSKRFPGRSKGSGDDEGGDI